MKIMEKWLEQTIIGLNLCPFAGRPFKEGRIQLIEFTEDELGVIFEKLLFHLQEFKKKNTTDLVYFKNLNCSFEDFYHLVLDLEDYIEQFEENAVQVVCFHPDFRFEGLEENARANLVNRSPYPTVHFLLAKEFDALSLSPKEAQEISFKNEDKLEALSKDELEKYFFYLNKKSSCKN